MKKIDDKNYHSIIPTAILTSYPRTLTDIPYAKEMFNELKKEKKEIPESLILDKLAPEIEARFKLINKLLKNTGINQILELAAGYSTRGLAFTKNKDATYVELDLNEVCVQKKQFISNFMDMPINLHIISGNALNKMDFNNCEKIFDKDRPVAVINEGLLRYLDFDEKKIVAKNIHELLKKFGGVWITCDITPKKLISNQNQNLPSLNKSINGVTDRNNVSWRFENENHVRKFFDEIGFTVEFYYFKDMKNELVSPKVLGLTSNQIDDLIDVGTVAIMRTK